jgi:hypothetical protein
MSRDWSNAESAHKTHALDCRRALLVLLEYPSHRRGYFKGTFEKVPAIHDTYPGDLIDGILKIGVVGFLRACFIIFQIRYETQSTHAPRDVASNARFWLCLHKSTHLLAALFFTQSPNLPPLRLVRYILIRYPYITSPLGKQSRSKRRGQGGLISYWEKNPCKTPLPA